MIARFATWGWLVIVFLALLESLTPGAVVGGAVVGGLLLVLFPPQRRGGGRTRVRPLALARYIVRFAIRLVLANVHVAWAVVAPSRAGLRRGIVAVEVAPSSDLVLSLLAISLSLTPGTSIVESRDDPPVLYVHLLQLTSVEQVRASVLMVQRELVEALGPAEALADIDRLLGELARAGSPEGGADR